jgi:hypothetical protein
MMYYFFFARLGFHLDDIEYTVLQCFFVLQQSILLPGVVSDLGVESMASHAFFKKANDVFVVRVLFKLQTPAVLHEVLEFLGKTLAELLQSSFHFLLLNGIVLLIFGPAWQTLPGE